MQECNSNRLNYKPDLLTTYIWSQRKIGRANGRNRYTAAILCRLHMIPQQCTPEISPRNSFTATCQINTVRSFQAYLVGPHCIFRISFDFLSHRIFYPCTHEYSCKWHRRARRLLSDEVSREIKQDVLFPANTPGPVLGSFIIMLLVVLGCIDSGELEFFVSVLGCVHARCNGMRRPRSSSTCEPDPRVCLNFITGSVTGHKQCRVSNVLASNVRRSDQ